MLQKILDAKSKQLARLDRASYSRRLETLLADPLPLRSFGDSLSSGGLSIIAEFKRRSPSTGPIARTADPAAQARLYQRAGADAISVLTDEEHFGGSLEDLRAIKSCVRVPVLRKDFLLERLQIAEARAFGADAVLLITGVLGAVRMKELLEEARRFGLDCLCEVHTAEDVRIAVDCGATIIGINNRNLRTFDIDLGATLRLRPLIPSQVTVVSESGIRTEADARLVRSCGVDAILVGTELMQTGDVIAKMKELRV